MLAGDCTRNLFVAHVRGPRERKAVTEPSAVTRSGVAAFLHLVSLLLTALLVSVARTCFTALLLFHKHCPPPLIKVVVARLASDPSCTAAHSV